VRVDAAGNVIGRRPGASRDETPVAVCAHLDTVFPSGTPVQVRRVGRRLVGPGIGDNGRGLAAMLALAAELDGDRVRTRHPIEFVATTGEEGLGDLRGAKRYFADVRDVRAAIALDGAGDERIVHRAVGSRRFRVEFAGPGGHSWAAFGVPNAVHAAARATARIAGMPLDDEPRVTASVNRMGAGCA
jgi:acetylornithine deacetylase/succinyl-diaminopimelate desuccinylase-like protein